MLKIIAILVLILNSSCGQQSEGVSTNPSATPSTVPAQVLGSPKATPTTSPTLAQSLPSSSPSVTPEIKKSDELKPDEFMALQFVVSQPYETNEWKFDLTNADSYSKRSDELAFMKNFVVMEKKSIDHFGVSTKVNCVFRVSVYIPGKFDQTTEGRLMLEAGPGVGITTAQPSECRASEVQHIRFKISNKCQGHNQDIYKCGVGNIKYDLVLL